MTLSIIILLLCIEYVTGSGEGITLVWRKIIIIKNYYAAHSESDSTAIGMKHCKF